MACKCRLLMQQATSAIGERMERYDFRTQRLYLDHELSKDMAVAADRSQANYLLNVLRLKSGDAVLLFNGRQGEWLARVEPKGRKACDLIIEKQTRKQPEPADLLYCFAPLKQARLDYMIQKAVEMGAGALQPVITQHTQVTRINLERAQANAVEAAEQCGILSIPAVRNPLKLDALLADWPKDRALVFCDEAAQASATAQDLAQLQGKPLALLIGPEGGFSNEERKTLADAAFVTRISLGPRILRADTAAVAALAAIQLIAGDWEA